MKIILMKDVSNLGEEGDICDVANGYARNFLLPKKFALLHTPENLTILEQKQQAIKTRKEAKRQEALSLVEKLKDTVIEFVVSNNESGQLFGAITAAHIGEELAKNGVSIDRRKIYIDNHTLKAIGEYKVRIHLYEKTDVEITVNVLPKVKIVVAEEKVEAASTEEVAQEESTS